MSDPELDELKREFLAEAQEKVAEIETTLGRERTPQSLERLIYLAHQLKGSGGSYGFQRISSESAELEKVLEAVKSGESEPAEIVRQHVANIRSEIERGLRELTPA